MRISCVCPTFNRVGEKQYLLEECVESFLRQTYADRELIVWNDHPGQRVVYSHPLVRVVNAETRCQTLGEKYNAMIEAATGEGIVPWEDDDICLPRRVEEAARLLAEWDYVPAGYWFLDGRGLHRDHPLGYCHGSGSYRRSAWAKVGGYPAISGPQDALMDGMLRLDPALKTYRDPGGPLEWQYVYRWGVSTLHLSGQGTNGPRAYDEYLARASSGDIVVRPHWRQDYVAMIEEALR